jgi:SAM-dependent methyltransferase
MDARNAPKPPHPRDISDDELSSAMASAARPDLLGRLVDISRRTFGFFPSHYHHTIGCPWVARTLEDLPRSSRVLDSGAGLSALPVCLAENGAVVDCVDVHPVVRTPPPAPDWNEWGFFDYRQVHPNLTSHHCAIADFKSSGAFNAVYSVGAIAHMTRPVRENALQRCCELLRPGGVLLLTADLIPSTDFIWNLSEGREVEPPEQHGSIGGVSQQLTLLGFQINEVRVHRMVPMSRTDLLFINCALSHRL